VTLHCCNW